MPQPPYAARVTNFLRDANNGITAPSAIGTDAELNALINVVNQVILRLRGITTSSGTLVNFAQATSQALAGAQDITATAAQTAFVTTITYVAAFNSSNVFVFVNNIKLATSAVTVANASGFLQVTLAAQSVGNIVTIVAFESGAGLLSRLQTISATDGASLLAINDAGGFFVAVQVEAALQEEATARVALATGVGNTADLIRRTGTVPFTAAQSMGGFKLTNVADGVSAQDAVTVNQFNAYTAVWNALQTYYMRLDGTTPMAATLPMGTNKITGLGAGTVSTDAVNKGQIDLKLSLDGSLPMTGPLAMGAQKVTGLAAGIADTDAVNVLQARSLTASFATLVAYQAAGTFAFVVPAGITKVSMEGFGGGGGGMASAPAGQRGGGGGAYAKAVLTVTAGESLTVRVGAGGVGGGAPTSGGNSTVERGATVLASAGGGANGNTAGGVGAGGTYAFDASVSGFGIIGMAGEVSYSDNDGTGHIGDGHGGDCPRGGFGGKGYTTGSGGGGSTYTSGTAPGGGGGRGDGAGAGGGSAGAILISY